MKGCIIGPRQRSDCEIWILEEGQKVFDNFFYVPMPSVVIKNDKVYFKGKDLSELDFVIPRIPRTYMEPGYKVLSILKDDVYMPIDPKSVLISHNKFWTLLALREAGIPVPDTYMAGSRKTVDKLLDEMKYPVVMKLLYGSLGKGVMFADTKQSAASFMDALERFNEPLFLEEYIENPGEDIRAVVVGGEVVGSMKRIAQKDERRTNIGIGGSGEPMSLTTEMKSMALKAADAIGMDVTGIDIIQGPKGPIVIEANVNVHFEGITKVLGMNIAKKIVEYVKSETETQHAPRIEKMLSGILKKTKTEQPK